MAKSKKKKKFDAAKAEESIVFIHGENRKRHFGVLLRNGRLVTDMNILPEIPLAEQDIKIQVSPLKKEPFEAITRTEHVDIVTGIMVLGPPKDEDIGLDFMRLFVGGGLFDDSKGSFLTEETFPLSSNCADVHIYCPQEGTFGSYTVTAVSTDKHPVMRETYSIMVSTEKTRPPGLLPGMPLFMHDGTVAAILRKETHANNTSVDVVPAIALPRALFCYKV